MVAEARDAAVANAATADTPVKSNFSTWRVGRITCERPERMRGH